MQKVPPPQKQQQAPPHHQDRTECVSLLRQLPASWDFQDPPRGGGGRHMLNSAQLMSPDERGSISYTTSDCFLNVDNLRHFADCFNLENLNKELETCKIYLQRQQYPPKTLLERLASLPLVSAAFPDIHATTSIACTLPVSSCAAERSFSTMRIIKNFMRTTMQDNRLQSLMTLAIHSKRSRNLDLDKVVNLFRARHPNCRNALI